MAGDAVTITIRADNGDAVRAFRDTEGRLRDMRGRFVAEGRLISGSLDGVTTSLGRLRGSLLPIATAGVPAMASLGVATLKTAGAVGGAAVALGAFGTALAGQVGKLGEASKAQEKYNTAVAQHGRGSKQAAQAQLAWQQTLAGMPNATARAAVALSTLKDGFAEWSDELAGFTMGPLEKSFALLGQALPRLTPMVQGASTQLDRLVSVAGGAMATPGFDALADRFAKFANESLKEGVDGIIHFTRALSEGQGSGVIQTFMEYAERNGPAVKETLANISRAVLTLVEAASEAGPGMLTLVNAAAKLVAALPPDVVATVMQLAVAFKVVSLAGAGVTALAGAVQGFGASLTAMRAASAAAGGGLTGLSAAFGTLSRSAKVALLTSGIGALVVAMAQLSEMGKKAPADVDRMTESLRGLTLTGKISGEAARVFGKDLSGFADSLQKVIDPEGLDQVQQSIVSFFGTDSTPVKEAKENIDGLDKALASLVKNGQANVAADALDLLTQRMKEHGFSSEQIRAQLDDYKSALADAKFEQELTAQSMGIFGKAAQDTSAKLDAQKRAADGLRASILALNETNRNAFDAETRFEESLDKLSQSFKDNGRTLDANTEKGRANRDAMSAAAKAHDDMIAAGLAAGESLGSMTKKSDELRDSMLKLATEAFGGNKQKAEEYVNTLLGVPGEIATLVKLEKEEAISGLQAVQTEFQRTPDAKSIVVETLNAAAIQALKAVGLETRQLPDGRTEVFTKNGGALSSIDAVRNALNNLNGKSATTYTFHKVQTTYVNSVVTTTKRSLHDVVGATGGLYTGKAFRYAGGGLVQGPGTGTSDDVFAPWLSNGEFVIKAEAVRKYGDKFLRLLNDGKIEMPRMASGGKLTDAEKQARSQLLGGMSVSGFGRMAGYSVTHFEKQLTMQPDMGSLVAALNTVRGQIQGATRGSTETRLLKQLDSVGKGLISYQRRLYDVNKALDGAKDKLNDLKSASAQLSNSVKSGILTSANISRGNNSGGPVTVATIMAGLTASRDRATSFAKALADLQKKGLRSDLLQQIAEAGTEGGGLETAGALLRASSSEISSLNALQGQIVTAAGQAGTTAANAVYGAAIKAQNDLVAKLQKSQASLEKSMLNLAKTMEKAISAAVGKKAAGGIVGSLAASGGVRSGLTQVGEQGPELLDLPAGARVWSNPDSRRMQREAWTSMLNTATSPARGVAPAAGQARPIVIHQTITLDGRVVARQIFDPLREEIHHRGGNVQTALGK